MASVLERSHLDAKASGVWGEMGVQILAWARKEFADEAWAYYHQIEKATVLTKRVGVWKLKVKVTIKGHDLRWLFVMLFGAEP